MAFCACHADGMRFWQCQRTAPDGFPDSANIRAQRFLIEPNPAGVEPVWDHTASLNRDDGPGKPHFSA